MTPSTVMDGEESVVDSRRTTPVDDEDEEVQVPANARGDGFDDIAPKGEVITCERSYAHIHRSQLI